MELVRRRLEPLDARHLVATAARSGALLVHNDEIRIGLGPVLARGLATVASAADVAGQLFSKFNVTGEGGPEGSGIVSFISTPFDRRMAFEITIRTATIVQSPAGTWLTAPAGYEVKLDELPTTSNHELSDITPVPPADDYASMVARAVGLIRRGEVDKVVLARSVHGRVDSPIDGARVALRLLAHEPRCTLYALDLPDGRRFVGASPELLVSSRGGAVACHPLAGTITTSNASSTIDQTAWLLGSHKNQYEHRVVVEDIVRRLTPLCASVRADREPSIVSLRSIAHLGTWIEGKLPEHGAPSALELLATLHPTPAVGGVPAERAETLIARLETVSRGHYAGAVGWCDSDGNGEWWVAIRGIMFNANDFEAWAGAGIVAESDPMAEREETAAKLASILVGLRDA